MVSKALHDLAYELDYRIPPSEKQAYLRSQQLPNSYVQSKGFRMRFLRSSLFDIPQVARRMVQFLDLVLELYGVFALQRPVRLSDFSSNELQLLRLGRFQYLPFGDRVGRRILMCFPDEEWESFPPKAKAKLSLYMSWVAGDDVTSQKKGIVVIAWFDKDFKISVVPKNMKHLDHKLHTTRVSALHICSPDTPFYRFRRAVLTMRVSHHRVALQTHLGNSIENQYALQSFGIPVEQIPVVSYSTKIKLNQIREWIFVRSMIEERHCHKTNSTEYCPHVDKIIEYPLAEDVVFRQGTSSTTHRANQSFRNSILSKVKEQENSRGANGTKIKTKKLISDIISEIRDVNGGRFLVRNEEGGWKELLDEQVLVSKIDYLVKEFRKSLRRNLGRKTVLLQADTPIFRSDYDAKQHEYGVVSYSLAQKVDEGELAEAATCVAQCFNMGSANVI